MLLSKYMEDFVALTGKYLRIGWDIVAENPISMKARPIHRIVFAGMGGSCIGGRIVASIFGENMHIPIHIVQDYTLPKFVDAYSLVIVISYSGNTEETLSLYENARTAGSMIVSICSGGMLEQQTKNDNGDVLLLPPGIQPRAAMPITFGVLVHLLKKLALLHELTMDQRNVFCDYIDTYNSEAKVLATSIVDSLPMYTTPVFYSSVDTLAAANRICQQINENTKLLCRSNTIPEANHNEMLGATGVDTGSYVFFFLTHHTMHTKVQLRMTLMAQDLEKRSMSVYTLDTKTSIPLHYVWSLILQGDWLSVLWAKKRNVDPMDISCIEQFKNRLG